MQIKGEISKIVGILMIGLIIWGFLENSKDSREALIFSAAEAVCEKEVSHLDCMSFASDVVDRYKEFSNSDPRDE